MLTTPLFSIVVATLNAARLLPRTIESLIAQSYTNWQLVVVDGASTDGTYELACDIADARIIVISEPDDGIGDAWNKGVNLSTGQWLIFLGAGDSLPSNTLSRLTKELPVADSPTIVYGDVACEDEVGNVRLNYGKPMINQLPKHGFPFLHPSCVVSRATFNKVGLFDKSIRIAVDSDWLLRAKILGVTFNLACHTVVMLDGGISDRNWLEANLEYADCVAKHCRFSFLQRQWLRVSVRIRYIFLKKLGISTYVHKVRRTAIFATIGILNFLMRVTPTFTIRRCLLLACGCSIHRTAAIHRGVRFFSLGRLTVGAGSTVNRGTYLDNRREIYIGSNVSIAHDSRIYTLGHDLQDPFFKLRGAPVIIKDRACLFATAIVLPGVTIGVGAVVLPGVVIQRDVPPFTIVRPTVEYQLSGRSQDLRYTIDHQVWLST